MGKSKFTISLLGFDERSADILAQTAHATMKIVDPVNKGETQVVVVDIDGPGGISLWNKFRQQWPHMPAVVVSDDDPEFDDASFAEKPFTVEELIDNITEAIILAPSVEDDAADSGELSLENDELEPEQDEAVSLEGSSEEMEDFSIELTMSDITDSPSVEAVSDDSEETQENEEPEFKSILDRFTEIEGESQSVSDEPNEVAAWFGSEENALTEDDAYEMDDLSLALNSADAAGYSSETASSDGSQENIKDDTTEIVVEPELEPEDVADEITAPEEIIDNDASIAEKEIQPLSEIAKVLTSPASITGALPSRTLDSPNPDDVFFDPDAHMIGLVLKGIKQGEKTGAIAKLACLLDRTIYIDARNKIVSSNLKDIHMRQIAIAPLGKGDSGLDTQLEMLESTSIEDLSAPESAIYSIETFVWELALLTSKGRVPIGTPMDKPTYLMQWPDFTRLMQSPNDMKIAAYWVRLPSSLIDLSENLNVPINDVRLMYSATFLTGLAGMAIRKSDGVIRPGKPEKHKNRNLFGSLMSKLKK